MLTIEKSIEVNVPVGTAYHQWTQFEEFPRFMDWVKEVHQLDDRHLQWKAEIGGQKKEWVAEIIEQTPDQRIMWTSQAGAINGGLVTFQSLSDTRSKVRLQLAYDPESAVEHAGDELEVLTSRVQEDLERFKEFIESWGRTACPPIMR
ncbi:MAG: SRPBCC family protein [Nitrospirota bacterium]